MSAKMLIDTTHPEETRVVLVNDNRVEDFDFESVSRQQLSGNIYLAKVTRVEPSLQAAFLDYGGNRHGFLAFSEIHPDYYQIPIADREALLAEEAETNKQLYQNEELLDVKNSDEKSKEVANGSITKASNGNIDKFIVEEVNEAIDDNRQELKRKTKTRKKIQKEANVEEPETKNNKNQLNEKENMPTLLENLDETSNEPSETTIDEKRLKKTKRRHYKIQEVIKVRQILITS